MIYRLPPKSRRESKRDCVRETERLPPQQGRVSLCEGRKNARPEPQGHAKPQTNEWTDCRRRLAPRTARPDIQQTGCTCQILKQSEQIRASSTFHRGIPWTPRSLNDAVHTPFIFLCSSQNFPPLLGQIWLAAVAGYLLKVDRREFDSCLLPFPGLFPLRFFEVLLDSGGFGKLLGVDGLGDPIPELEGFMVQLLVQGR